MQNFTINGGKKLAGSITVNTSKNAAVALLAGSVMNRGTTTLKDVPQIEEVNRWIEILLSIGMSVQRKGRTIILTPPKKYALNKIDIKAAQKTRSIILLAGALVGQEKEFSLPQVGGCRLGARSIEPHAHALGAFGVALKSRKRVLSVARDSGQSLKSVKRFALSESGDTVTENALFAAAQARGVTEIRFASANYMVQDICHFLVKCGIKIEGIGTTTLRVHGSGSINKNITYQISEDPIEAMFFIAVAIATKSEITIKRCPYDFIELELTKLSMMGLEFVAGKMYKAHNTKTTLVDLKVKKSTLKALPDKIEERPFPGINMDNLPFFAVIATQAKGVTLLHDWAYENRAVYFVELNKLGGKVELIDQHRAQITGPTKLTKRIMSCPPALRPGAVLLVAMLGAKGQSVLKDIYMINRGYENLPERLRSIGADITLTHNK